MSLNEAPVSCRWWGPAIGHKRTLETGRFPASHAERLPGRPLKRPSCGFKDSNSGDRGWQQSDRIRWLPNIPRHRLQVPRSQICRGGGEFGHRAFKR